jgi:shikimate kinase
MGSEAGIVSLGGGSVLNEASQKRITTAKEVVFLDVSISNAAPRVGFNKDRPLLAINPRQQWLQLMEKRRPIYESLATITVSTDNKKPDQVADEIIEAIEQRVG